MAIVRTLATISLAVIAKLLADEAKDWIPWLTKWIKEKAVRRLPIEVRDRYAEEWESDLLDIPGNISRLVRSIGFIRAAWAIATAFRKNRSRSTRSKWMRRVDVVGASFVLFATVPALGVLCALIRLESPGPVFVKTLRIRGDGTCFWTWSLRTMRFNSLRLTRTGLFIRKYHLDQIQRLFNILKGDLTFFPPNEPRN